MVVSKRRRAHDLHEAVGLDRQIGLHAERNIQTRYIPWIDSDLFDPPYLRTSRIAHAHTWLDPAGESKVSMIRFRVAPKRPADGKDRNNQQRSTNQYKETHQGLFGF